MSKHLFSIFFVVALSLNSFSSVADTVPDSSSLNAPCLQLLGKYSFKFEGTSFNPPPLNTVPFTETGVLQIKRNGDITGKSDTVFQFSDFAGAGSLWLLVREELTNGRYMPDSDFSCFGVVSFLTTGTVLNTSNPAIMPVGAVLFADSPRSLSYSVSGNNNEHMNFVLTSVGMVATGTGHKQRMGFGLELQ